MGKKTVFGVTTGVLVLGGLIAAGGDADEADTRAETASAEVEASAGPAATDPTPAEAEPTPSAEPEAAETAETTATTETAEPVTVVHVVDGDTVYTSDGGKIRLIGYDTPETGECGFDEAKALVASLVLDQRVEVVNPAEVDDVDTYDRELRYVRVGGEDLGRAVLEAGLANARYDGEDGYDRHPLQDQYREISARVDHQCAGVEQAPESEPQPAAESGSTDSDATDGAASEADEPWNQPGPDLDCGDIGHEVRITGEDFHRLDRDGDGWGCDSA